MERPWSIAATRSLPFETHPCLCRSEHAPSVPWTHRHHIHPLSEGGPDTLDNIVHVCPATHDWIHVILREFAKTSGPQGRLRHWPHYAYEVAVQGWVAMS